MTTRRRTKGTQVRLTDLERGHLLVLLRLNIAEGAHDGDPERWWERTKRLIAKLAAS